jgi:hypothetical protein
MPTNPTGKDAAREALMYLVLFSTLYMSAYHLGDLFFDLINRHLRTLPAGDASRGRRAATRTSLIDV